MASYYGATDAKGYRLRLDIGAITQDVNLNQSSFPWSLYLECGLNYFQTFASTFSLVLDGTTVFSTTTQVVSLPGVNSSVLLCSGNKTVNHNSDGTKSVSFNGSFRVNSVQSYTPQGTLTVSGSFALATIPRAALLNSFADFQIETTAGAINGNLTIYSASFNHTLDLLKNGSIVASWSISAGPVGSYNFALTLSVAQRNLIFYGMPSEESATFTLVVKTFNGGTQIGTDQSRTATGTIPTSYKPSITSANSDYSWTNKNNKLPLYLIQNVSTLSLQLVGGSAPTGASLSEYKVRFGSITRQGSYNGLTITENVGLITSYGTLYAYYSVKDSRGRWSEEIIESLIGNSLNVRQYSPPVSNGFDVIRNTAVPTSADYILKFSNSLYSIGNTWTYTLQYWNGSSWAQAKAATTIVAASIDSIFTHALPYSESSVYTVKAILTDQFNTVEFTDDFPTSAFPLAGGIWTEGDARIDGTIRNAKRNASYLNTDTNANDITEEWVLSGNTAGSLNFPSQQWWYVHTVLYSDGARKNQVAYSYQSQEIWRRYLGATWSAWVQIYPQSSPLDAYPVGSVFTSVLATSPATLFGGTWIQFASGRFLVGYNSGDSDFNASEKTGGAKTHVHGLSAAWAAIRAAANYVYMKLKTVASWTDTFKAAGTTSTSSTANTAGTSIEGSTDSASNLPPYIVVYMWKRTA